MYTNTIKTNKQIVEQICTCPVETQKLFPDYVSGHR